MKMKEVDLINHEIFVREFYDKMTSMYVRDYETRIKDLEVINQQMAEQRLNYAHFKDLHAPKEDPLANIAWNSEKLDAYNDENKDRSSFTKLGDKAEKDNKSVANRFFRLKTIFG
jgi:hypothetical protein